LLFKVFDQIKETIDLFAKNEEININYSDNLKKINKILKDKDINITKSPPPKQKNSETTIKSNIELKESHINDIRYLWENNNKIFYMKILLEENIQMKWVRGELIYYNLARTGTIITSYPLIEDFKDNLKDTIEILITSDEQEKGLKSEADVDQVKEVHIIEVTEETLSNLFIIKKFPDYKNNAPKQKTQKTILKPVFNRESKKY